MEPHAALKELAYEKGLTPDDAMELLNFLETGALNNTVIVGIREFIESPWYMNAKDRVWPKIMEELEAIIASECSTFLGTGGIGSAKTTIALYLLAYSLYKLSCMGDPHALFELDKATEILFIFQNLNAVLAKSVDYARFRAMIDLAPYFKNMFPYDKSLESELRFPNRIIVRPVTGQETAAIGQNVFGGLIDEVNYMETIVDSKRTHDGGEYDQAEALYQSIARRQESRFMVNGKLPGILCLVSSRRYPGQFTDRIEEEARRQIMETGISDIWVYDKRLWEVCLEGRFSGGWFKVFIGDALHKPRILEKDEKVRDDELRLVMDIPVEYRTRFEGNMLGSLRDIAGVSTLAIHPFMLETAKVSSAFGKREPIAEPNRVDFVTQKLEILQERFEHPDEPRFVHLDLGITGDSLGMAVGWVSKFVSIDRGEDIEVFPEINFDLVLEVVPPKNGEILFYKARQVIYALTELGLNVRWVSLDSFQSVDTLQILRSRGYITGKLSVDETTIPYDVAKEAFYDGRIYAPPSSKAVKEWGSLEFDPKKKKIDHPPNGSKDLADAMAGVIYGLTMRREIWARFGVPVGKIPKRLIQSELKGKNSIANKEKEGALAS